MTEQTTTGAPSTTVERHSEFQPVTNESINIRRFTGTFGLLTAGLFLISIPLYFVYSGAPPDWNILTRILLGLVGFMLFIVFLVGFRQIICQADPAYEWVATLAFVAGLIYIGVSLVAQSMEAGTAIATADRIDPTVEGPLAPGQFLIQGAIGRALIALFSVAAGYAVLRTHALPAWSGWLAYALAILNLAFVPSIYFGSDADQFYSAVGFGTTAVAGSFLIYWIIAVSIVLVRTPQTTRATAPAAGP